MKRLKALVGIDIGTTNIKVNAFTIKGKLIYKKSKKNKLLKFNEEEYFNPTYIKNVVLEILQEICNENIKILSIGISSLAESVVPVIDNNNFEKTIVWYDRRTESLKKNFIKTFESYNKFYKITGLTPNYLYTIHKLQWYQKYNPKLFNKTNKFLPLNSFIAYILTNKMAMDYTLASRTGALNIVKRSWSDQIFNNLSFNSSVFPKLTESGRKLGIVKNDIKRKLNIDYDIPVSLGGHDHICGSFPVIAFKDNYLLDSMGTAENILTIINKDELDIESYMKKDICVGVHIIPNKYYIYKAFDSSGALINNLASLFLNKPIESLDKKDFELLINEARKHVNDTFKTKLYIEQNEKPKNDETNLKGINILNINASTTRGKIFLEALRNISRTANNIINDLEEINNTKYKIIAIGGSTRNDLLMKEKEKIINKEIYINQIEEAVTLGAALLGGLGAGIYKNYKDILDNIER